ncbi:PilZ domain-containing protein [Sphingomonadaceae bacterium]|nr:PilZ domain-containing protein [Sphingomonadaceae bacterium]
MASAALEFSAPDTAPDGVLRGDTGTVPTRRDAKRLRVLLPGKLIILGGVYDCAIEDVSQTGARLIADVDLAIGQQGILQCHPLDELFSVVWTDGKSAGIQFDEEVALGAVRTLRWHNDRYREQHDAELRDMVQDWATGNRR